MREGGYKIIDFKNKAIEEVTRWDVIREDIINSDGKSILISGLKYGGKVLNDFCTTVEVNAQNYIFLTIIATSTKCVDLVIMENEALYRYYYLDQIDKKIADGDNNTLTKSKTYTNDKFTDLNAEIRASINHTMIIPTITTAENNTIKSTDIGVRTYLRSDIEFNFDSNPTTSKIINGLMYYVPYDSLYNPQYIIFTPEVTLNYADSVILGVQHYIGKGILMGSTQPNRATGIEFELSISNVNETTGKITYSLAFTKQTLESGE